MEPSPTRSSGGFTDVGVSQETRLLVSAAPICGGQAKT